MLGPSNGEGRTRRLSRRWPLPDLYRGGASLIFDPTDFLQFPTGINQSQCD